MTIEFIKFSFNFSDSNIRNEPVLFSATISVSVAIANSGSILITYAFLISKSTSFNNPGSSVRLKAATLFAADIRCKHASFESKDNLPCFVYFYSNKSGMYLDFVNAMIAADSPLLLYFSYLELNSSSNANSCC